MVEPDFTFTDADGNQMRLYMLSDGDVVLRWPSDAKIRFTKKQFDTFMEELNNAVREGKPLNINFETWIH